MSKSLGNFYRIVDIEKKGFNPLSLRYLFLTASYRQQMNFTWKSLEAAANAYSALQKQLSAISNQQSAMRRVSLLEEKLEKINKFRQEFTSAVNDDLNTAKALAITWEVVKSNIPSEDKYDLLLLFDEVLGLNLRESRIKPACRQGRNQESRIPEEIKQLAENREQLRREKKWEEADKIRQQIVEKGFTIEDTSSGAKINPVLSSRT
jgi:cysteinyl-tRNA synthetase